jgi:hypothetical protein
MRRHLAYLWYVLRHKWFVFQEGRKLGLPLWQLIKHDWSKFSRAEWFPYAATFYNEDGSKKDYEETVEFTIAWMHHQHNNPHHWQYWCQVDGVSLFMTKVLIWDRGVAQGMVAEWQDYTETWRPGKRMIEIKPVFSFHNVPNWRITCDPMPDKYRREMLADWRGAGRAINGVDNTRQWYDQNRDKMKLHLETRAWIESQLDYGF